MGNTASTTPTYVAPSAYSNCMNNCANDPQCHAFAYRKNDSHCWKKHLVGWGGNTGIKEKTTSFVFNPNNPYVTTQVGAQPLQKDYRSTIDIQAIVCQDCRQGMSDITATDSQAALTQTNQCIA